MDISKNNCFYLIIWTFQKQLFLPNHMDVSKNNCIYLMNFETLLEIRRHMRSPSSITCRPVARFQSLERQNTFLGGHDFCFYHILKTNFSGSKKMWGGTKEIWGHCPRMPRGGYGPDHLSILAMWSTTT